MKKLLLVLTLSLPICVFSAEGGELGQTVNNNLPERVALNSLSIVQKCLQGYKLLSLRCILNNRLENVKNNRYPLDCVKKRFKEDEIHSSIIEKFHILEEVSVDDYLAMGYKFKVKDSKLDLGYLALTSFDGIEKIKDINTTKHIDCTHDQFTELNGEVRVDPLTGGVIGILAAVESLRVMHFPYNKITTVTNIAGRFPNLVYLNLHGNKIENLDPRVFNNNSKFGKLNIQDNPIGTNQKQIKVLNKALSQKNRCFQLIG